MFSSLYALMVKEIQAERLVAAATLLAHTRAQLR